MCVCVCVCAWGGAGVNRPLENHHSQWYCNPPSHATLPTYMSISAVHILVQIPLSGPSLFTGIPSTNFLQQQSTLLQTDIKRILVHSVLIHSCICTGTFMYMYWYMHVYVLTSMAYQFLLITCICEIGKQLQQYMCLPVIHATLIVPMNMNVI